MRTVYSDSNATMFDACLPHPGAPSQVGAVLVSQDNIILGIGYNGFPRGCSDSQLPWAKCAHDGDILATK